MTDLEKNRLHEYLDGLLYLAMRMKKINDMAPIKIVYPDPIRIQVREYSVFKEIEKEYKTRAQIKDKRKTDPAVYYKIDIGGIEIWYIALKGDEGYDLEKGEENETP